MCRTLSTFATAATYHSDQWTAQRLRASNRTQAKKLQPLPPAAPTVTVPIVTVQVVTTPAAAPVSTPGNGNGRGKGLLKNP